jgi:hypothetical protein
MRAAVLVVTLSGCKEQCLTVCVSVCEKALEFTREPGSFEDAPQCGTVDGIVGLGKIDEAV